MTRSVTPHGAIYSRRGRGPALSDKTATGQARSAELARRPRAQPTTFAASPGTSKHRGLSLKFPLAPQHRGRSLEFPSFPLTSLHFQFHTMAERTPPNTPRVAWEEVEASQESSSLLDPCEATTAQPMQTGECGAASGLGKGPGQ